MDIAPEKIIIADPDPVTSAELQQALHSAGYDAQVFSTTQQGLDAIHQAGAAILILDSRMENPGAREAIAILRGSVTTEALRVLLLVGPTGEERADALDMGANDAISRPYTIREVLAHVRARLRVQRIENQLRDKMRIADEGQQIAHHGIRSFGGDRKDGQRRVIARPQPQNRLRRGAGTGDCDGWHLFCFCAQRAEGNAALEFVAH